jgi:competence protein ComEC
MILSLVFGFIFGIALGSFLHFTFWFLIFILVVSLGFFLSKNFVDERRKIIFTLISISLLGFSFGLFRVTFSNLYSKSELTDFINKKVSAEGIVVGEPDERENNVKLTIKLSEINNTSVSEKILVTVPLYPEFHYGDKVKMKLLLEEPKNIESDDGRVFNYKGYLRVRGIWYTAKFAEVEFISSHHGAMVFEWLFSIKNAFTTSLRSVISEPESSLLVGLLLGSKQSLGKELLSEFQKSGVSHVVVLSGYNIAIVAESIMALLIFLPKNLSFGFGALGIILFTVLSGGGASAYRAAIMVLVALFAKKLNRDYKVSRALGFAVVLMLSQNPTLLVFDPSFQLSILATIGLVFVSPYIEPYLKKVTEKYGFREIVASTIATQVIVLPYLIYTTGVLSLVSLPVNILILGTIPITMLLGFITGMVGLLSFYLSFIPAFFTYILLWYQLTIVHLGAVLPYGAINLPVFSPIILVFIYAGIFWFLYAKRKTISHSKNSVQ